MVVFPFGLLFNIHCAYRSMMYTVRVAVENEQNYFLCPLNKSN